MDHQGEFRVGQRVRTTDGARSEGWIVEDFGSLAGVEVVLGAKSIRSRRWAVQFDDGQLQFLDDDGIEPSDGE